MERGNARRRFPGSDFDLPAPSTARIYDYYLGRDNIWVVYGGLILALPSGPVQSGTFASAQVNPLFGVL
jgi:hypothetical protein